jgi:hypothetical protein
MIQGRNIILALIGAALGVTLGVGPRRLSLHSVEAAHPTSQPGERVGSSNGNGLISAEAREDSFTRLVSLVRGMKSLEGRAELYRALSMIPAAEIPALIERARKLPLKYRNELTAALFERWMELDRTAALAWIRQAGRGSGCYQAWAAIAPREALDFLFVSDNGGPFYGPVTAALDRLAGKDFKARLDILGRYPQSPARHDALKSEMGQWALSDPAAALKWLGNLPDDKFRKSLIEDVLPELAKRDPAAAMAQIDGMISGMTPTMVGNGFISNFAKGLAEKDPTLAMQFAEGLPPEFQVHPMIAAVSAWAKTDPVAALDWALANGVDPSQHFRTETASTSTYVLGEGMNSKPAETAEWLLNLPPGPQRTALLRDALFSSRAKVSIDLAKSMFDALPPESQIRTAYGIGYKMVDEGNGEFPAMNQWISQFPDETVRARAIGGAIGPIFGKSPARAEAALATLPEGPIRDQALSALTNIKSFATPTAAAEQALEIRDPIVRYDALDPMMNQWMTRDRQTAEDWLDSQSDLPREWVSEWKAIKPLK